MKVRSCTELEANFRSVKYVISHLVRTQKLSKTYILYPLIPRRCGYQGVRNARFHPPTLKKGVFGQNIDAVWAKINPANFVCT